MNRKWIRRIIALIIIGFLAVLCELWANRYALLDGNKDTDVTEYIGFTPDDLNGEAGTYELAYEPPEDSEGLYVHELLLYTQYPQNDEFKVTYTYLDTFDNLVEESFTQPLYSWCFINSTYIDHRILSLRITLEKPENGVLQNVVLANHVEWNKYRLLLLIGLFSLLYCAFFEKAFFRFPERFFAVFTLFFGVLLILSAGVKTQSWDEEIHYGTIIQMIGGAQTEWTEAEYDFAAGKTKSMDFDTKTEYVQMRQYMNALDAQGVVKTDTRVPGFYSYTQLAYIPCAIFLKAGKLLNMSFSARFYLGKMGNLLVYLIVMYLAIRMAKKGKLLLTFIAMMPTAVFQASSYTYDSVVFSLITLGLVLAFRQIFTTEGYINTGLLAASTACIIIGSLSKAVYIPLLAVWIIPIIQAKGVGKGKKACMLLSLVLVIGIVMSTFVMPTVSNTVSGNLSYGGDLRGGDTSAVRQLMSILEHPVGAMGMFLKEMFRFDNLRNLGKASADNYVFPNLMMLNFGAMGVLPDPWVMLLMPLLTLCAVCGGTRKLDKTGFIITFLAVFLTDVLIWLALYLAFTPVGQTSIKGVQARYFLPLSAVIVPLLPGFRVTERARDYVQRIGVYGGTCVLMGEAFFRLVLAGRLM